MAYNYLTYTLQVHDHLLQMKDFLRPFLAVEQVTAWEMELDKLNAKLEDMRFQVAVVGEFKRGKSSFINALLRKKILPADVAPTTATINRITYGDVPASYIHWSDGRGQERIAIEQLADYITKLTDQSEANARLIQEAVVTYPCRFCENNVDLIDTPGMNDDDMMNSVTIRGLADIDLAIVTLSPVSPVSSTEARFIARLVENDQICQIIYVLSMMDAVDEDDRQDLIDVVERRLKTSVRDVLLESHHPGDRVMEKYDALFAQIVLFPVSAKQALAAYDKGDTPLLERSGFRQLNEALLPIIIRSQHSAAILTPLRVSRSICEKFHRCLDQWKNCADEEQRRQNLRSVFANTAYDFHLNYDEIHRERTCALTRRKREYARVVSSDLCKAQSLLADRAAFVERVKTHFQRFKTDLAREETGFYQEIWDGSILPAYKELRKKLTGIVIEGQSDNLPEIEPFLAALTSFAPYSDLFPQPEDFYWERSPIPLPGTPPGQIAYAISSAVQSSFDNYYARREQRLALFLEAIQNGQTRQVEALVQKLFQLVKKSQDAGDRIALDRKSYESLTARLRDLSNRCDRIEKEYLAQSSKT